MDIFSHFEPYLVHDDAMARAYEHITDRERAWMKKQIAHLCACYTPADTLVQECISQTLGGLSRRTISTPLDFVGAILDGNHFAWNKILALLVPGIMYNASQIGILILADSSDHIEPELLTALELAGIEDIYCLPRENVPDLFQILTQENKGHLFVSQALTSHIQPDVKGVGRCGFTPLPREPKLKAGIWAGPNQDWDWDTISWANPDVEFVVSGENSGHAPQGFKSLDLDRSEFINLDLDVFYGPAELFRECQAPLGLSPGMESCWVWPGITPELFLHRREFWGQSINQA